MSCIGIDESGRGSLFGPVFVAGVSFQNDNIEQYEWYNLLNDSKKLSPKKRKYLVPLIKQHSTFHISSIDNNVIDDINILNATFIGMNDCISNLKSEHSKVFIDGSSFTPNDDNNNVDFTTVIKGDSIFKCIMAASILAKEAHDDYINNLDFDTYYIYDIFNNMGYGTKRHIFAITNFGLSSLHRVSFCSKFTQ